MWEGNEMKTSVKVSAEMKCAMQEAAEMICAMEVANQNPQWMRIICDESNNQNKMYEGCSNCSQIYDVSIMWNKVYKESWNQNEI